jgi:hypothetical protein
MNAQWLRGFTRCQVWIKVPSVSLETLICPNILGRSPSGVECARQFWTSIMLGPRGWSRKSPVLGTSHGKCRRQLRTCGAS